MLHQIKAPQFYTNYLKLISLVMDYSISEVEFLKCKSVFFVSFQSLKQEESLREVLEKSLNFTQSCPYEPWFDCFKCRSGLLSVFHLPPKIKHLQELLWLFSLILLAVALLGNNL